MKKNHLLGHGWPTSMKSNLTIMALLFVPILLIFVIPANANAQTSDRIMLLDNFGTLNRGEELFIYGNLAQVIPNSYLILEIVNPEGDLCQIQQLTPLSNGYFITESIPLQGRICGISGNYDVKLFYGDYSKTSTFVVATSTYQESTTNEYLDLASKVVSNKIDSLTEKTGGVPISYSERLSAISSQSSEDKLSEFEQLYADLWSELFIEDEVFEINPTIRPIISGSLDATSQLVEAGKISFDTASQIDREVFSALFYFEIADTRKAIKKMNDIFVTIKNVDPIKISSKPKLTYAELEGTLLNIMKKTGSVMSRDVKEEVGFIFARGTAPIYVAELNDLIDLLSESRLLDVLSRKDSSLYRVITSDWESTRLSLIGKSSIEELLGQKEKIDKLYLAALLLRDLDKVDRFISSDKKENSDLANLLLPEWETLSSKLETATSPDDIINLEQEIKNMKNTVEISSRISKAVEITQENLVNSGLSENWISLLQKVEQAQSMSEILEIVSDFDQSIIELREKRNPITTLKFEYDSMKAKAELQADYKNLFLINNALKILETAKNMEEGNPTTSRIDRIEVLLTWASQKAPEIKSELDSYSKDAYQVRASDILQRAKSLENLVELSLTKNRFFPGYTDYTESVNERLEVIRNLVISNDLDEADIELRDLFAEWREVTGAYENDPYGSQTGYSKDELKRIQYRENLESFSTAVNNFYNPNFDAYADGYEKLNADAYELIDYGNFIDAESKINEIGNYLSNHLILENPEIIFDISYDLEQAIWIISGFVDKPRADFRENLYLTIYDVNGEKRSTLEFTDTREGKFFTQWEAPIDPGLYVVMLQYENKKASQVIHIAEQATYEFTNDDLDLAELAREFEELESFIKEFGGEKYEENNSRLSLVISDIKRGLADRDEQLVKSKLDELQHLIERYLPIRSRSAVIEAQYENDQLYISGAVQKTISFSEDLFVDIFSQSGKYIDEIALKDTSSGHFNEVLSIPLNSGTYVVQLEYHDLTVTDFFTVT